MEYKKGFTIFFVIFIHFLCPLGYAETLQQKAVTLDHHPTPSANPPSAKANDPFEKFNRAIFFFNDQILDRFLFKPVATIYNQIMPKPLNRGVHNFFGNLNNLPTIANDLLQLHFYQASSDFWRLTINSTIGIGGFFDVAKGMGLNPYSNDFGLTLATWGYRHSYYLVLPVFGPNTVRDGIAIPVDYYVSVYPYIHSNQLRYGLLGLGVIDWRAQLLKYQSVMDEIAIDKYAFQRDAYLQRRQFQIKQSEQLNATTQLSKNISPEIDVDVPGVNIGE